MAPADARSELNRLLIVLPNWVGDVVMATGPLSAIAERYPNAERIGLVRPALEAVLRPAALLTNYVHWPSTRGLRRERDFLRLANQLRRARFDAAVLFTNSLRSALLTWLARIPRRVGYARDGRGILLTERLRAPASAAGFTPEPMPSYYARLADQLGAADVSTTTHLKVDADERAAVQRLMADVAPPIDADTPYALLAPGAAFGKSKCWLPERYAQVAQFIRESRGWRVLLSGAPSEQPLLDQIAHLSNGAAQTLPPPGTTLGTLKALVAGARLLVCNDSGPRHYGVALRVPTVTIFGPTDPRWTESGVTWERIVRVPVPCGPCQLPECPLDHRCMREVSVEMVNRTIDALLATWPAAGPTMEAR